MKYRKQQRWAKVYIEITRISIISEGGEFMTSITTRISIQEKQKLAKYAFENDLTISQITRKLLRDYIKEIENETRRS